MPEKKVKPVVAKPYNPIETKEVLFRVVKAYHIYNSITREQFYCYNKSTVTHFLTDVGKDWVNFRVMYNEIPAYLVDL